MSISQDHYTQLYHLTAKEFSFRAHTKEDMAGWQTAFRRRLCEALGLARMEAELVGYTPRAEQLHTENQDGYTRETWRIWTETDVSLPFYLLRPLGVSEPLPLVLTPHGHNQPHLYVGLYDTTKSARAFRKATGISPSRLSVKAI